MIDRRIVGKEPTLIKRLKKIRKCINIILYIIIIPVLIINITMIIKKAVNSEDFPSFMGYKSFIIITGSMENTLMPGDFIVIKEEPEQNLKNQDIITFNSENIIITHRIVNITDEDGQLRFTTKGDNNNCEDSEKIGVSQIEGKYIFKIPMLGKFLIFFQSPMGLIILIMIPIIIGLIYLKINNYITEKNMVRKAKRIKYNEGKNEKCS